MSSDETDSPLRRVFISHRHSDSGIAQILSDTIREWSDVHPIPVRVFQSSDPSFSPIDAGKTIRSELLNVLADVDVLLLVYTRDDENWSWCMWETGVATNPKPDEADTTIVVFKCYEDAPEPFKGELLISMNEKDIKKFTEEFHTREDFFSKRKGVFAPTVSERIIASKAKALWDKLHVEIERHSDVTELKARWIRIYLRLTLSDRDLIDLRRARSLQKAVENKQEIIKTNCLITRETVGHAFQHFDVDQFREKLTLWELFETWKTADIGESSKKVDWYGDVAQQMVQCIRRRPALEVHTPMKSAKEKETWYLPIISSARSKNNDTEWEFLLELCRIPEGGTWLSINHPPDN